MKLHTVHLLDLGVLFTLLLIPACAAQPQPDRIEETTSTAQIQPTSVEQITSTAQTRHPAVDEISFQSGSFKIVGDLRLPEGIGPFPVVLLVHGSGDADRSMFGYYLPVMERILRAGYAVFSWDKPGYGESTGKLSNTRVLHQRAQIVLDAIELMKAHQAIDPKRIGLWGISQAGYVMPLVLSKSKDVVFMICVSCVGMAGNDQMAYQISSHVMFCEDLQGEKADQLAILLTKLDKARTFETYQEYLRYREVLDAFLNISPYRQKLLDILVENGASSATPEEAWLENDPEVEARWNPVEVLTQVRIPLLAIFGDRDSNGDPIQGAYAWRKTLEHAGNQNFRVELFPGVDHFMAASESSCINEQSKTFDQVLEKQGYGLFSESLALFQREPGQHTPLSAWPYAPEYLDLIEEWLQGLYQ